MITADAVVGADSRGFDGGKLIIGRKRHVVADTLGLLWGVMVTSADVGDRAAAKVLLALVLAIVERSDVGSWCCPSPAPPAPRRWSPGRGPWS
ncbi:transposase [Streptomyces boncukensis]|uniref:Transposase n=1 Tax=Streptomyces boncukensis TaxID=2711219 RepID=A0A6G4WUJ1_9ACTN|nr:transposase [Streptomyces boncukensis]NGO68946.1 transposase [Streptomyces boncukensis]